MLEVGSGDLSLNVRGFENNDEHAVERFRAFCESNFGLSREVAASVASTSDTVILSLGASEDELRALAQVMIEIGALVEISRAGAGTSTQTSTTPQGPNGRVGQIFRPVTGRHAPPAIDHEFEPAGPIHSSPTTHQLRHDITIRTRRSRRGSTGPLTLKSPQTSFYAGRLWNPRAITLSVLLLATVSSAILIQQYLRSTIAPFPPPRVSGASGLLEPRSTSIQAPRSLYGSVSTGQQSLSIEALVSNSTVSVSTLALTIERANEPAMKAQAEPLFLTEREPGIWIGQSLLSVVNSNKGIEQAINQRLLVTIITGVDRTATAQITLPATFLDGELDADDSTLLLEVPLSER